MRSWSFGLDYPVIRPCPADDIACCRWACALPIDTRPPSASVELQQCESLLVVTGSKFDLPHRLLTAGAVPPPEFAWCLNLEVLQPSLVDADALITTPQSRALFPLAGPMKILFVPATTPPVFTRETHLHFSSFLSNKKDRKIFISLPVNNTRSSKMSRIFAYRFDEFISCWVVWNQKKARNWNQLNKLTLWQHGIITFRIIKCTLKNWWEFYTKYVECHNGWFFLHVHSFQGN